MLDYDSLIHGDCLDVLRHEVRDFSVDLILCDPPYGTTACKWDSVIPFEPLWNEYRRILTSTGTAVIFGQEPFSSVLRTSAIDLYKYDWIWCKNVNANFLHAKNEPLRMHEIISVFSKGEMGHDSLLGDLRMIYHPQNLIRRRIVHHGARNANGQSVVGRRPSQTDVVTQEYTNYPTSILKFTAEGNHRFHPTQKPVELLRYLIRTYSDEGMTVLDSTMGSGSTCVAAVMEHRHYIGIEKEKQYFDIACRRVKEAERELTLF